MTAPPEPDLDLSHLLVEAPVPPLGAARAARLARKRRIVHRVATAGVALVVVVALLAATDALRFNGGERTVRTADHGITATLLTTADVQRALPDLAATPLTNGGDVAIANPAERAVLNPAPRAEFTRQWTWNGGTGPGPAPDRIQIVINGLLEFENEGLAIKLLADATATAVRSGDQTAAFVAIPGATEFIGAVGSSDASTRAVLFPRGRYVYSVSASGGGNHADAVHQLAVRQAELAQPGTTSCPISAPRKGAADALPREGATTLDHVRQTTTRYEPQIRADFAGVASLSVGPRNGDVWAGTRGDYTVHRAHDYWIVVHLEQAVFCPDAPAAFHSFDGVPLHFVVG